MFIDGTLPGLSPPSELCSLLQVTSATDDTCSAHLVFLNIPRAHSRTGHSSVQYAVPSDTWDNLHNMLRLVSLQALRQHLIGVFTFRSSQISWKFRIKFIKLQSASPHWLPGVTRGLPASGKDGGPPDVWWLHTDMRSEASIFLYLYVNMQLQQSPYKRFFFFPSAAFPRERFR